MAKCSRYIYILEYTAKNVPMLYPYRTRNGSTYNICDTMLPVTVEWNIPPRILINNVHSSSVPCVDAA